MKLIQAVYYKQNLVRRSPEEPMHCVGPITITLPFAGITARAIIVRRRDGALLGTQHYKDAKYALPGGSIEEGETPEDAILRELEEEQMELIGSDEKWQERIVVDYYHGYRELSLWYIFVVDNVLIGDCDENIETKWVEQNQNIWHPYMHKLILFHLERLVPELVTQPCA